MTGPCEEPDSFLNCRQGDVIAVPSGMLGAIAVAGSETTDVAVISQSCDVVREDREWITVAVVEEVSQNAHLAARGSMPQYVPLHEIGPTKFIDLDRVASLKKADIVSLPRTPGVSPTDWDAVRRLSRGLGRKFSRFAFPDAVVPWFDPLRPYFEGKHEKQSSVGRTFRAISELRVQSEDWSAGGSATKLHVIVKAEELPESDEAKISADVLALGQNPSVQAICDLVRPSESVSRGGADGLELWNLLADALAILCMSKAKKDSVAGASDAISSIAGQVWSENDFSLSLYRRSEMLDLDHLSSPAVGI